MSMYPNDLGLKEFTTVGAPCLETITLVDKVRACVFICLLVSVHPGQPAFCPRRYVPDRADEHGRCCKIFVQPL